MTIKHAPHDVLLEIYDLMETYMYEDINGMGTPSMIMPMGTYHNIMDLIKDALGGYVPGDVISDEEIEYAIKHGE
jgi:hypothetical protein